MKICLLMQFRKQLGHSIGLECDNKEHEQKLQQTNKLVNKSLPIVVWFIKSNMLRNEL